MKHSLHCSRDLGLRSFGSFGNRPIHKTATSGINRKSKTGKIHSYPFRRDMEEK